MRLKSKMGRYDVKVGDLVLVEPMDETGIVVSAPKRDAAGFVKVSVMMTDTDSVVIDVYTEGCHLISRPLGSDCQPTPFPDELLLDEGPNPQKISSENFPEHLTLTIDEDIN